MSDDKEYLLLKWGTLKGWNLESDKARELFKQWAELGYSMSAMTHKDTPEQKRILCELIDAVDGDITNDWSGEDMSKEKSKKYIMEYGGAK